METGYVTHPVGGQLVDSKAVVKVVGAFLAGVLLALGGAILYSRQTGVSSPAQPGAAVAASFGKTVMSLEAKQQNSLEHTPEGGDIAPSAATQPQKLTAPARARTVKPQPVKNQAEHPAGAPTLQSHLIGTAEPARPFASPTPAQNTPTVSVPLPPENVQHSPQTYPAQNPAAPPEPHVVTLPEGTTLNVRLAETLSSDRNGDGDTFHATLEAPIIVNGFIIAERRSKVAGRVVGVNRAGRVKGLANLALAVSEINTTDGQRLPVETDSYEKLGNSSVKSDTAKVAGGAALGAIIGAIAGGGKGAAIGAGAGGAAGTGVVLGTRGSAASVPSESILTFRLARPVTITEKFN